MDANYGFAGGYDRALEHIEADYYVLLNSDVETPRGGSRRSSPNWSAIPTWRPLRPACGRSASPRSSSMPVRRADTSIFWVIPSAAAGF